MNNTYFNKEIFPEKNFQPIKPITNYMPTCNATIENVLKLNTGKKINVYMLFPNSNEKNFQGILEVTAQDHITVSEPQTGIWHMLPYNYIEYITFEENINYTN